MLELRPRCEHCNKPLPPDSLDARIRSFECTFRAACVDDILGNVCPNFYGSDGDRHLYDLTRAVVLHCAALLPERKPERRLETNVEFYTALLSRPYRPKMPLNCWCLTATTKSPPGIGRGRTHMVVFGGAIRRWAE